MLSFEFNPVEPADFMKHIKALETAGLVKLKAL